MNVLITVFTILMMVAALTYARLETFLDFNSMHTIQREYMRGTERKVYNASQEKLYETEKSTEKEAPKPCEEDGQLIPEKPILINYYNENAETILDEIIEEGQKKENLLSYLDWNVLVNMKSLDKKELFDKTFEISKRLILVLYGNQPFFLEARQKYPNLEELILIKIIEGSEIYRGPDDILKPPSGLTQVKEINDGKDKKEKSNKISRKRELAEIPIEEEDLRQVYYKIMKGSRSKKDRHLIGYPPLTDFITISTNKPISIYLAPFEILISLFQSPEVAHQIMAQRKEIYTAVCSGSLNVQEAERQLQTEFDSKLPNEFRAPFVSFKVSKTNPKAYD